MTYSPLEKRLPFCRSIYVKKVMKLHAFIFEQPSYIAISVYLKTIDHLNVKLLICIGILQVLRFDFQKFRILEILNFHPCTEFNLTDRFALGLFSFRLWPRNWEFSANEKKTFTLTLQDLMYL